MAVLFPCGRTLCKQVLPRSSHLLTRLSSTSPLVRVSRARNTDGNSSQSQCGTARALIVVRQARTYATATPKRAVGRPKAHTGRTTAKRTTTAGKATRAKKPAARKAKPKKKVKAKAKAKPRAKKRPLTEKGLERKAAHERAELKKKALLTGAPKKLPETAWQVCFVENGPKKGEGFSGGAASKTAAQAYRNAALEERERLNHTANQNKAKNDAAHKKWVQSFTPLQIKEANHARDMLKRQAKAAGKKTAYSHIQDDRLVKSPANAYSYFLQDRYASGDLNGMKIGEIGKLVAREWKELSPSQKKPFNDKHQAEKNRYLSEYKSVYGIDSPSVKASAAA